MVKEILAKLYQELFDKKVEPKGIEIVNVFVEMADDPIIAVAFLANGTLTILFKVNEGENIYGFVLDSMMLYAADIANALKASGVPYDEVKLFLLAPKNPFGISKREDKYESNRFSPIEGPSLEELKSLNIPTSYTTIDLEQNQKIEDLFYTFLGEAAEA